MDSPWSDPVLGHLNHRWTPLKIAAAPQIPRVLKPAAPPPPAELRPEKKYIFHSLKKKKNNIHPKQSKEGILHKNKLKLIKISF